jgi:transcriptional regulator with XRE-family HTH domain
MPRRTVAKHGPHPVDVHVGGRVRMRRTLLGMTQMRLGDALELTFQQVQKNEGGFNRIGASRLYQLSHILDVPVGYFFEGLEGDAQATSADDVMLKRETLELAKNYYRISDPKVRDALGHLTKAMAKGARSR